ncbi:MAG: alpha/beta hydrolase, partial [Calditrichaeota bacterium]|nr:alpha/beta hydrolase [Calditrichota bacterium]
KHNRPEKISFVFQVIRTFIKVISVILPPIGVAIAYRLFFKCRSFARPAHEWKEFKSATKQRIKLVGQEIQLYEWGQGDKKILFHHGWQGRGSSAAAFVQPLLDKGYKVVAFDGPAHGESTGKKSNLPEFAEVLNEIVKRYDGFEAIIAHSFGGMVTSYALQRYKLDVKRLVFISSPFTMSFIISSFSAIINTTQYVGKRILEKIEKQFNITVEDISGEYLAPKQDLPLLLIHDEDDNEVPISEAIYQNKLWNGSLLIKTSELGHRKILRDDDVIIAVIEFIRQKQEVLT